MATAALQQWRSETSPQVHKLHVRPQRRYIVTSLLVVIGTLALLSLAGQVSRFYLGYPNVLGLVPLFYLDLENNIPTWYQTLALVLAAVLLLGLGIAARRTRNPLAAYWFALSLIFVFLSLDEAASLHEATMEPLQRITGRLDGVWQPLWVILGMAAVIIVAAAFRNFFLHLSGTERIQVLAAGALFIGGAMGMEMVTAALYVTSDPTYKETFTYVLLAHVEEVLEMLGVVVFIDFLLRRLSRSVSFSIAVEE